MSAALPSWTASAVAEGELDVQRIGSDRVRIRTADAGEAAAEAMLEWLRLRREVTKVRYHMGTGVIDVRYQERAPGGFLRSLRDRVFTMALPETPKGLRVSLAHAIEGRARFQLEGASDD